MNTQTITFQGRDYKTRTVRDNEGLELIIAGTDLLDALHPREYGSENDGFAGPEAEKIYNKIFYFTEPDNLCLDEKDLIKVLSIDNPEWFV